MASFTSGIKYKGTDIASSSIYYAKTSNSNDLQFARFDEDHLTDLNEYGINFTKSGSTVSRVPAEFRFIKSGNGGHWGTDPYILGATTSNPNGCLKYKGKPLPIANSYYVVKPIYSQSSVTSRNTLNPSSWGNRRWAGTAGGTATHDVYFRKKSSGNGVEFSTNGSSYSSMTSQNVVIFECCAGGGAGGGAWGGLFGWDAGTGGGGGAYICFIVNFDITPKIKISYGDGGNSKAGKNGSAGVNTIIYCASSRTTSTYKEWYTLKGGGGGRSEVGSANDWDSVGEGGGWSGVMIDEDRGITRAAIGGGGDGGCKDPGNSSDDSATSSEKHGKSPTFIGVTYNDIFYSNTNRTRTGGGPRFIGKSGAKEGRDGGGGGGCTLGSFVNPQWTTGAAPNMTGATIYGYGGGSNGGACMDGNNYNAWAGRPGAVIAHYQTTY